MYTLEQIEAQIRLLPHADTSVLVRKEIKSLPEIIVEGELIKGLCNGFFKGNTWLIVCTNKRLVFLDKGFLFGFERVDIPLEKVNSVGGKTGLLMGAIEIWDGAAPIKIDNIQKAAVAPFVAALQQAISDLKSINSAPTSTAQIVDVATQIQKLGDLKEKGLLTEDEFLAQKKKLLAA